MARLQSHLVVENELVEPSPQVLPPEGSYIARTLAQNRLEVPVRVLNSTHPDQKLTKGTPLAQREPVTLVTPPDLDRQQDHESSSKLQDMTEAVRPHLSNRKFRELEEFLAE
jgi:hypothetical protein